MSASGELYESFVIATKLSSTAVKALDGWYARQNLLVKIEIFKEQKNQFFKYVKAVEPKEIVPIIAYYLAIQHFYDLEVKQSTKNKSMNLKEFERATDLSVKKFQKIRFKVKQEKLLNLWSVVEKLRFEGFSFREIAKYLQSKHRFEVSHTYVAQVWRGLKNEC